MWFGYIKSIQNLIRTVFTKGLFMGRFELNTHTSYTFF